MLQPGLISLRTLVASILLTIASAILLYEIVSAWPYMATYIPGDYAFFLDCGHALQKGIYNCFYPYPAVLLIFLPLSVLPTWFALVWIILPFLFVLYIFGKKGIAVWLSYPFLVQAAFGELDGLLLLPIYWLIQDHPALAGISAALLSLKPQLAILLVPFMIYRWLRNRNRKSLVLFSGTMVVLYLPAFLLDPGWPAKMIAADQIRISESIQLTRGATLWGWWWHGDWTLLALPFVLVLIGWLTVRTIGSAWKQSRTVHLLNLMFDPILYAVSFITAIPTLKNSTLRLIAFTAVSWIGVAIDTLAGGWGGAYVLIPLTALYLLAQEPSNVTPPIPIEKTAR